MCPLRKGRRLIAFAEHALRAGCPTDAERLIGLAYKQFDRASFVIPASRSNRIDQPTKTIR